ncbi:MULTISPECIES: hypothetical protein [Mameliella]|uniref:hypothetical protein n=1 Tax=Mameliella TaxID=1434019 RepID=UPI0008411906|nr:MULTISPECIES: hypothetical protein [Mameliella]MCR9272779.1 excinuclease ABC subunit A [Paracoccaceae bacterium]ODM45696.1 hypothetical protein A9320_09430 [Ruegeria sp. PBVC088]MBY6119310.1 excinuclease ABC subunit A [Mameliella alba]MDD9728740.1 excinuclease ABC subunit A [Mameliella sp. AT18]OWV45045.1 excinuclease ABC subunit A [Mameliella alba]
MKTRSLAILVLAAMPLALPATAQPKGCPPGLAKKDPACVPPGLAKKGVKAPDRDRHYITDDYVILVDPLRYGLDPDRTYYRLGDEVVRVDRETGEILNFIGSLAALLD